MLQLGFILWHELSFIRMHTYTEIEREWERESKPVACAYQTISIKKVVSFILCSSIIIFVESFTCNLIGWNCRYQEYLIYMNEIENEMEKRNNMKNSHCSYIYSIKSKNLLDVQAQIRWMKTKRKSRARGAEKSINK